MPTSPHSTYLARCFRALSMALEQMPCSAHALGSNVELIGFAMSERQLGLIAKEHNADIEEMDNGDLFVDVKSNCFHLRFYLCRTEKDGK